MKFYEMLAGAWRMPDWLGVGKGFQDGFFAGIALFLIVFLSLLLIKRLAFTKRSSGGISIEGSMGTLYITSGAVREFVARVLQEFKDIRLRGLKLFTSGKKTKIVLEVGVHSNNGLPALRDAIQSRVITEVEEKLGLSMPPRVDLKVRSLRVDTPAPQDEEDDLESDNILEP